MRKTFAVGAAMAALTLGTHALRAEEFRIELPAPVAATAYEGRLILILTTDDSSEPRFQVDAGFDAPQIFGLQVEKFGKGQFRVIGNSVLGYPGRSLSDIPAGTYTVQAVLHKYDSFTLANG